MKVRPCEAGGSAEGKLTFASTDAVVSPFALPAFLHSALP